jgi:hypothetical protein
MRFSTSFYTLSSLSLASAQVTTGQLGDAIRNLNDPQGAAFQARIMPGVYGSISGSIVAVSAGDKGTEFAVNFAGLPKTGGPFRKSSAASHVTYVLTALQYITFTSTRSLQMVTAPVRWDILTPSFVAKCRLVQVIDQRHVKLVIWRASMG